MTDLLKKTFNIPIQKQGAAVADATDETLKDTINLLLSSLRTAGIIAQ